MNDNDKRGCPCLYLIVPCYNEEEIIRSSAAILKEKMMGLISSGDIKKTSRIMFVDDGSRDETHSILTDLAHGDHIFSVVSLIGNRGQQNAILAGLMTAKRADAVITIDADLQQDVEAIDDFLRCYKNGAEVVYGVRRNRDADGFFKRMTASGYYTLMHMMGCDVIRNHADYRLISRKVIDALSLYDETNLFLRGLIPTMGFPSDIVYCDVKKRTGGSSKYTLAKMIRLATDGITSFSIRPLRIISFIGFLIVFLSACLTVWSFIEWMLGRNVRGYTTLILVQLFSSGTILLSLGVIGEYVGKIYTEAKKRPKYIIDSVICGDPEDED